MRRPLTDSQSRNGRFFKAFIKVIDTSEGLNSTNGMNKAFDYADAFTNGAKYKNDISFLRTIDYVVDVEKVMKKALTPAEFELVRVRYLNKEDKDRQTHTEQDLTLYEKVGKAFVLNGLYPISDYFGGGQHYALPKL